jgi:NAD(P)-dependent dehydrogenase (short-subunit alcohol dehydrogenase family)
MAAALASSFRPPSLSGELDLLDPKSIDAFVDRYVATGRPLHVLINNAGIMAGPLVRDARGTNPSSPRTTSAISS